MYEGTSVDQWRNERERRNEDEQTDYQNLKRDEVQTQSEPEGLYFEIK